MHVNLGNISRATAPTCTVPLKGAGDRNQGVKSSDLVSGLQNFNS